MINANHKLVPTLFFLLVLLVVAVPVTAQEPVTATLDPAVRAAPGEDLEVGFDLKRLHFFHPVNGRSI